MECAMLPLRVEIEICNIGALIIRFRGHYTIVTIGNPQNSIGNNLGPKSNRSTTMVAL